MGERLCVFKCATMTLPTLQREVYSGLKLAVDDAPIT